MKGTEYRRAVAAIDKTVTLRHYRPETAHRAIGAVLAYMGALRADAAVAGERDGAGDRRLIRLLADAEDAAVRLDAIPQRAETAAERGEHWARITKALLNAKVMLERERKAARVAERLAATG